ncbi:unnamed protein product, partial [Closterium sp. Naga37s-1]
ASRCFFRDSTTVTPLTVPVPVTLADPSRDPVVARGATILPCSVAPSGLLTGSCPRFRGRLRHRVFPASRGGSAPLLTPRFLLPLFLYAPCTWTCEASPASLDRLESASFCWL